MKLAYCCYASQCREGRRLTASVCMTEWEQAKTTQQASALQSSKSCNAWTLCV